MVSDAILEAIFIFSSYLFIENPVRSPSCIAINFILECCISLLAINWIQEGSLPLTTNSYFDNSNCDFTPGCTATGLADWG